MICVCEFVLYTMENSTLTLEDMIFSSYVALPGCIEQSCQTNKQLVFLNCVVERGFLGENLNIPPSTSAQHHLPCAGCKAICAGGPLKRLIQQKLTMTMAFWSCLELRNLWLFHPLVRACNGWSECWFHQNGYCTISSKLRVFDILAITTQRKNMKNCLLG